MEKLVLLIFLFICFQGHAAQYNFFNWEGLFSCLILFIRNHFSRYSVGISSVLSQLWSISQIIINQEWLAVPKWTRSSKVDQTAFKQTMFTPPSSGFSYVTPESITSPWILGL